MNRPYGIAAVILAAGRSSRMGAPKPLLPLGSSTVIERVVGSVLRAGVRDIVVVTGHEPERLAPILDALPARPVHNAGYDAGMFSSVRTGVAALDPDVEAFFILPADYPLVRTEALERLIAIFRGTGRSAHGPEDTGRAGRGILHLTCCGRRGHPPLLSGRYREALLHASDDDDLRSFLQRHGGDEAEVEVEDLTILLDMDTAEDYRRLCRFASVLDGAGSMPDGRSGYEAGGEAGASAPGGPADPVPSARSEALSVADALFLLSLLEVPDRVVRHCCAVAKVGETLARALKPHAPSLEIALVRTACLLHDIARTSAVPRQHALVGQKLLGNLGLARLGEIIGAHMVLPPEQAEMSAVTETQLVYLADKLVAEDRIVNLEERTARTLRELGGDEAPQGARVGLRSRMQTAQRVLDKVEAILHRPLVEMLDDALPEVMLRERTDTHSSI
jgi:molybdenum cofactor cytidylyltransferase